MIVQVYTNRGNKYVRVVHSYRDPETNKPKMKVIKNYGNLEKLLKQDKKFLIKLEKEIEEKNNRLKETSLDKIKRIEKEGEIIEGLTRKNYGYLVYEKIWKELKLDKWVQTIKTKSKVDVEGILKQLVYQRLLSPSSKKSAYEHRNDYINFKTNYKLEQYYKLLEIISDKKEDLEIHINKQLNKKMKRELNVVLYDVTTYYFESTKQDEIKKFGFSKDNKVNQVQVVMGLLIDNNGIPINYELYKGNTNEFSTLYPVIKELKIKYNLKSVIVAADRGLNSGNNLLLLKELGLDYIMAYKLKGARKEIKEHLFTEGFKEEKEFKYKIIPHEKVIKDGNKKHLIKDNLLLGFSEKRAKKDKADRERLIEKAEKIANKPSIMNQELKKGGKKYLKISKGNIELELDIKQIEEAEKMDGYFAIEYSKGDLSGKEVKEIYGSLWKIEDSFRVLKTNLEARPIFVWSEDSIRAHFLICYIALTIQRYLEKILKDNNITLSTTSIQDAIRSTTIGVVESLMGEYYIKDIESNDFLKIINALDIKRIPLSGFVSDLLKCIYEK